MLANSDFRRIFLGVSATPALTRVDSAATSRFPLSCGVSLGGAREVIEPFEPGAPFPRCVQFRHCNIVQEPPCEATPGTANACSAYDTVLCLSTSKWVHLHSGDAGLLCLFHRIHAALRPGGLLLLEPQPWSSYRKAAGVAPHVLRNYNRIQIKPPGFRDVLLNQIGFASCEQIDMPDAHEVGPTPGFAQGARGGSKRPLLLLTKA
jgi:7SK snRNA methylphosphate capping enzyme